MFSSTDSLRRQPFGALLYHKLPKLWPVSGLHQYIYHWNGNRVFQVMTGGNWFSDRNIGRQISEKRSQVDEHSPQSCRTLFCTVGDFEANTNV